MSEQTPALPAIRVAPELDPTARLGKWLAAAETDKPDAEERQAAAALRIYFAEALGLPPMAAFELSMIHGRLSVSAKLKRALAGRAGYRLVRVDSSDTACTARLLLDGEVVGETTYTMAEAQAAGLVRDGSGYKKNPARMMWARASSRVVDDFAPEAALGLYTTEEIAEIEGEAWEEPEPEPAPSPEWEAFRKGEGPYPPSVGNEIEPEPPGTSSEPELPPPPDLPATGTHAEETFAPPKGKRGGGGVA